MEARLAGDFRIVQQRGIEIDGAVVGTAAEEIDDAAAAHHVDGPLPGLGFTDGFDGNIGPAAARQFANLSDGVGTIRAYNQLVGAEGGCAVELRLAAANGDYAASVELGEFDEHEANRAETDHRDGIARLRGGLFEAAHYARERLHQSSIVIADMLRNEVSVALDNPRGNTNIFRISAVIGEQIFAEILQTALAEIALL